MAILLLFEDVQIDDGVRSDVTATYKSGSLLISTTDYPINMDYFEIPEIARAGTDIYRMEENDLVEYKQYDESHKIEITGYEAIKDHDGSDFFTTDEYEKDMLAHQQILY